MNDNDKKRIYQQLAAPFPEEAIERSDGKLTGRGYNTTGIKVQYVINRLNETLGLGGWRAHRQMTVVAITTASGRKAHEAICDLVLQLGTWLDGDFKIFAEAPADGGHNSVSEADARKGAYTNALKKAAAMFGCGRQAYEGTLDEDNTPATENPRSTEMSSTTAMSAPPRQESARPEVRTADAVRSRLTAKQLSALWSISRKLGMDQIEFRQEVKTRFGVQVEFLTRHQASELISTMGNGGGHGQEGGGHDRQPGQEG